MTSKLEGSIEFPSRYLEPGEKTLDSRLVDKEQAFPMGAATWLAGAA